jgi:hypothetical protein
MWLELRRLLTWGQMRSALHHMPEAGGGLRPRGPPKERTRSLSADSHSGRAGRPRTPNRPHPYPSEDSEDSVD